MLEVESLQWGFLVFARVTSCIFLLPFFSIKNTPALVKIGFGAFFAALLMPVVPSMPLDVDLMQYAFLIIRETLVGLTIGYISMLTFSAFRMAGEFVDIQMGFSMAVVLDLQSQSRITLMGQFFYIYQILLFMAVDGHHTLLRAIAYSYTVIPMSSLLKISFVPSVVQLFIQVFALSVRIALPFIVVFVVCDVALGLVARTVPQLNIFIMSFPIKTGAGLLTLIVTLPLLAMMANNIFTQMTSDIGIIMMRMVR